MSAGRLHPSPTAHPEPEEVAAIGCRIEARAGVVFSAALDAAREALAGREIFGPPVFLWYGFREFNSPSVVFPLSAVDDRGARYDGLAAVDWIIRRGQRFPRSDAFCVRPDGAPADLMLRELDLAVPCRAFVSGAREFPGQPVAAAFHVYVAATTDAPSPPGLERLRVCVPVHALPATDLAARGVEALSQAIQPGRAPAEA